MTILPRGEMNTRKLVIFEHNSALGNAQAHTLFDAISITRKDMTLPPRAYSDYVVSIDKSRIPDGVTVRELP